MPIRESHGISLFYLEQPQHYQALAELRDGLGEAEFQRLQTAGANTPLDDLIDEALATSARV